MKEQKLLLALNELEDEVILEALGKEPGKVRRFRPSVLLVAAMLTGLLVMSVGAAVNEAGWFQKFFAQENRQPLTPGQAVVVQTSTKEFGQSITREGYTVTLESVIADARNCYLKVSITAPEGTVLNNEMGYGPWLPRTHEELDPEFREFVPADGTKADIFLSQQNLEDGAPEDNQVTLLYRIVLQDHTEVTFETSRIWRFTIRDLSAWGSEEDTVLIPGDICFDIEFDKISAAQLTFIQEPIPYTFTLREGAGTVEGTITSCTLRPMGGTLVIEGCTEAVGFNLLPVVMKDGTQVRMGSNIWGTGTYTYTLKVPIDLDEVDHLLLPDGTKLYPGVG